MVHALMPMVAELLFAAMHCAALQFSSSWHHAPAAAAAAPAELPSRLQHLEAVNCGLKGPLPALPRGMKRLDLSDNALTGQLAGLDTTHMEVGFARSARVVGRGGGGSWFIGKAPCPGHRIHCVLLRVVACDIKAVALR
jgi:hypothetical protein